MSKVEVSAEHAYETTEEKLSWEDRLPPPGPVDIISLTGFGLQGTFTREELEELENRPNVLIRSISALARRLRLRPPQSQ